MDMPDSEQTELVNKLITAVKTRLAYGHAGSCILILGQGRDPCNCGHTNLANALFEVVKSAEKGDSK